jgi:hypothetical protein
MHVYFQLKMLFTKNSELRRREITMVQYWTVLSYSLFIKSARAVRRDGTATSPTQVSGAQSVNVPGTCS